MFAIFITDKEFLKKVKDNTNNPTGKQAKVMNRYFTKEKTNESGKCKLSLTEVSFDKH